MIVEFLFVAERDCFRLHVPQLDFEEEMANLAAIDTQTKKIVSVFMTADEMEAQAPEQWKLRSSVIEFMHPFSRGGIERGLASACLRYLVMRVALQMRPGLFGRFISRFDAIDYDLLIPEYEAASIESRKQFEHDVKQMRPRARGLRLNGRACIGR